MIAAVRLSCLLAPRLCVCTTAPGRLAQPCHPAIGSCSLSRPQRARGRRRACDDPRTTSARASAHDPELREPRVRTEECEPRSAAAAQRTRLRQQRPRRQQQRSSIVIAAQPQQRSHSRCSCHRRRSRSSNPISTNTASASSSSAGAAAPA